MAQNSQTAGQVANFFGGLLPLGLGDLLKVDTSRSSQQYDVLGLDPNQQYSQKRLKDRRVNYHETMKDVYDPSQISRSLESTAGSIVAGLFGAGSANNSLTGMVDGITPKKEETGLATGKMSLDGLSFSNTADGVADAPEKIGLTGDALNGKMSLDGLSVKDKSSEVTQLSSGSLFNTNLDITKQINKSYLKKMRSNNKQILPGAENSWQEIESGTSSLFKPPQTTPFLQSNVQFNPYA